MTTYTTEGMPAGYTLIRYGAFQWSWKTADYVSDFVSLTAGGARDMAMRHAKALTTLAVENASSIAKMIES